MDATKSVMRFDGQTGYISLPLPLPAMPAGITIEFWAFGADDLPSFNSIFHASIEPDQGSRLRNLNIHLPWHGETIYWDAGSDRIGEKASEGEYDRIDKKASAPGYKGHWRHWAFVKDVAKGEMSIYYEGGLWHHEVGKKRAIPASPFASIGSNHGGFQKWSGRLTEFRIWDRARSGAEISAYKDRRLTGAESGLISLWPLDRINPDGTTPDLTGRCAGQVTLATVELDDALPIESVPDPTGPILAIDQHVGFTGTNREANIYELRGADAVAVQETSLQFQARGDRGLSTNGTIAISGDGQEWTDVGKWTQDSCTKAVSVNNWQTLSLKEAPAGLAGKTLFARFLYQSGDHRLDIAEVRWIGTTASKASAFPPDQPLLIKADSSDAATPPSPLAEAPLSEVHPIATEFQATEPLASDHIMSWKTTTSGLEDYAMWRMTLKDERLEGDPPFRRGRIWA